MRSETRPPKSEPMPREARIAAHAPAPPSDVFAITAPSTTKIAVIMFPIEAASTITHTHVREANSCQPSRRDVPNDVVLKKDLPLGV